MRAIDWLLDSDPAIGYQAMRDLTDASADSLAAERARIPHEGLGARILLSQQPDGAWRAADRPAWLTTLFTLQLLRATGIDPTAPIVQAAAARLEAGVRWNDLDQGWELRPPETGGNTFFQGEEEPCINGGALAVGSYFGHPEASLVDRLLKEQLEDGGWNCEAPGSRRSSFHTTVCVLEGLLEFERAAGPAPEVSNARRKAEEYLLERSLYRRLSTGEIIDPQFLQFAFPPRYCYDVLRALDYFRSTGAAPDPRLADALTIVERKQQSDGGWPLDLSYEQAVAVPLGESVQEPSRWNTLRALRVLRWRDQSARSGEARLNGDLDRN